MDHEIEVEYDEVTAEHDEVFSEARQSSNPDLSSYQDESVIIVEDSDESEPKLRRSVSAGHIIYANATTPKNTETTNPDENPENALMYDLFNYIIAFVIIVCLQ